MRKLMMAAVAATMVVVPAAAQAQGWQPIAQRKVNLDRRIDMGVRNGALTRGEATRLARQLDRIVWLERDYRRSGGGLSMAERRDLDRRYNGLSRRVYVQKRDRQYR